MKAIESCQFDQSRNVSEYLTNICLTSFRKYTTDTLRSVQQCEIELVVDKVLSLVTRLCESPLMLPSSIPYSLIYDLCTMYDIETIEAIWKVIEKYQSSIVGACIRENNKTNYIGKCYALRVVNLVLKRISPSQHKELMFRLNKYIVNGEEEIS